MTIREAKQADFDAIWAIFREVVRAGTTYAYSPDTTRQEARELWIKAPRLTFVLEKRGEIVGTYYLKTNQAGGGDHVCNCGYMVASAARGHGVAALMCGHSQAIAQDLGYQAMQFNFVISTNTGAIRLWQRLGFDIVGTLPDAFRHPDSGLVDALVMYKRLRGNSASSTSG